jgi:hypothetical protein
MLLFKLQNKGAYFQATKTTAQTIPATLKTRRKIHVQMETAPQGRPPALNVPEIMRNPQRQKEEKHSQRKVRTRLYM